MTVKKSTKIPKFKVIVEMIFGPYRTADEAAQAKVLIKRKSPKIKFTAATSNSKGRKFKGRLTFIQQVATTAPILKQAFQEKLGDQAKVSVTKM